MRDEFNGTTVSIGPASVSIQKRVLYGSDVESLLVVPVLGSAACRQYHLFAR